MKRDQGLKERLDRLAGPVDRRGVWVSVQTRATVTDTSEGCYDQRNAGTAGTQRPGLRRRLVCIALVLLLLAGVTVGTVFAVGSSQPQSSGPTTAGPDETQVGTAVATPVDYSGGGDWRRLVLSGAGSRVSGLVMDPSDSQVIYAATEQGLYKTIDGAGSWDKILDFVGDPEVAVDPLLPNTVYVAYPDFDSPWIRRSDDGGGSWVELDASVVLGNDQKSEYFFDGASFGAAVTLGDTQASTVYMDTDSGEWKSVDRGESWTGVTRAEIERETVTWWSTGRATFSFGGWDSEIDDADDGGSANVEVVVVDPSDPEVVYAGSFGGGVFKSSDGGETWHRASTGLTSDLVYGVIPDPVYGSTLYALTDEGVQRSTNGGATWTVILPGQFFYSYSYEYPGGSVGGQSGTSLVVAPSAPSTLYALNGDAVKRTTDGGDTWEERAGEGLAATDGQPTPQMGRLILVDSSDPDIVMATTYYQLLRSEDAGDTWSVIPGLWGAYDLLVDPGNPQVMYTRAAEADVSAPAHPGPIPEGWDPRPPMFLFKSVDGGVSWSKIPSPEVVEHGLLGLDSHDPAWLYAVDLDSDAEPPHSSTMVTRDGGFTWEAVDLSGGGVFHELPLFDPFSPDTMYTKVINWEGEDVSLGGVYRSTDGGVNWEDIVDDTVAGDSSLTLVVSPADGTLYGYSPLGLFKWTPLD